MSIFKLLKHFSYSAKPEAIEVQTLEGFGTPGEKVVFSFSICCSKDIPEIEVSASPLVGEKVTIDSGQIEIYIVKLSDVSGVGVYQSDRMTVPELLLKDDRTPLNDGYIEHPYKGIGSEDSLWLYNPPNIRLVGNANTSLSAGESKQIWLSVKIPDGIPAANYIGSIKIAAQPNHVYELPLELEVLPFDLLQSKQDLMFWYRGSMDAQQSQFYVSQDMFQFHLQDIYNHGFRSISINEKDRAIAQLAIDIAEQVGFDRHMVFRNIPFNAEALRFDKLKPVYCLSDEVDMKEHSLEKIWTTMLSLENHQFIDCMNDVQDIDYKPMIISLSLSANKDLLAHIEESTTLKSCLTYYHWLTHMEKPNLHRVLAGVYLWKSKADGIAPYCYQHPPIFPFSPFDDFDAWEPFCHVGNFRDRMTTYPAQFGVIPTSHWEGLREGIVDLRYLTTLDHVLTRADALDCNATKKLTADVRQRRDTFLSRINFENIDIESEISTEPYPHISAREYHEFRRQIAVDIKVLLQMIPLSD